MKCLISSDYKNGWMDLSIQFETYPIFLYSRQSQSFAIHVWDPRFVMVNRLLAFYYNDIFLQPGQREQNRMFGYLTDSPSQKCVDLLGRMLQKAWPSRDGQKRSRMMYYWKISLLGQHGPVSWNSSVRMILLYTRMLTSTMHF